MRRRLTILVILGFAAGAVPVTRAEVVERADCVLDVSGEIEMLLWLSEGVLNATEAPAGFPAAWWPQVEATQRLLARAIFNPAADASGCLPRRVAEPTIQPPAEGVPHPPAGYAEILASSELVVVAKVERVEPGAVVFAGVEIGPRVRVVVSEVLRDAGGSLAPGDELVYLGSGGRLRLGQGVLCGVEAPEQPVPEVGARVILAGSMASPGGTFVNPSAVHPAPAPAAAPAAAPPQPGSAWHALWPDPVSEAAGLEREILWTETWDGQPAARFIPEEVIQETPLESLPMGEGGRQELRRQLSGYDEQWSRYGTPRHVEPPGCSHPPETQVLPHEATTLERAIVDYSTFSFTGKVVAVVTGWETTFREVAQVAYVSVDSILYDPERRLREGEVLGFFQFAGEMKVGDSRLCTRPNPNQLLVRTGERILLAGGPRPHEDRLIHADLLLPVKDGVIQPVPTATLLPMEALPLPELEARVAARLEEVR